MGVGDHAVAGGSSRDSAVEWRVSGRAQEYPFRLGAKNGIAGQLVNHLDEETNRPMM